MVKLDASLVDLSDGMLELLLIRMPKTLAELNRILLALTAREYTGIPEIILTRAESVSLSAQQAVPFSLDGEYEQGGTDTVIHAIPGAVNLIV